VSNRMAVWGRRVAERSIAVTRSRRATLTAGAQGISARECCGPRRPPAPDARQRSAHGRWPRRRGTSRRSAAPQATWMRCDDASRGSVLPTPARPDQFPPHRSSSLVWSACVPTPPTGAPGRRRALARARPDRDLGVAGPRSESPHRERMGAVLPGGVVTTSGPESGSATTTFGRYPRQPFRRPYPPRRPVQRCQTRHPPRPAGPRARAAALGRGPARAPATPVGR
jgi:hypothetical protein